MAIAVENPAARSRSLSTTAGGEETGDARWNLRDRGLRISVSVFRRGRKRERINKRLPAGRSVPAGPRGVAMTPACGPRRFAGAPVSERGPQELRGLAVRGRRGAGGVLRGARPPAAPFESRGAGREKRGGRPQPLARRTRVVSVGGGVWKFELCGGARALMASRGGPQGRLARRLRGRGPAWTNEW